MHSSHDAMEKHQQKSKFKKQNNQSKIALMLIGNNERGENKMTTLKNKRDLQNEYGLYLRWINGDERHDYRFFIENQNNGEIIEITDEKALAFISSKTTNAFRDQTKIYSAHVQLFEMLGLNPKRTFRDLLKQKELSGYKLAKITNIPQSTISDWITGKKNILKAEFSNIMTVCRTLEITAEELYNYLTKNR